MTKREPPAHARGLVGSAASLSCRGASPPDPIVMRFDERAIAIAQVRDLWEKRQVMQQREDSV
jgi:hypothetical protein